ncbi:TetR family transcriptional regulator [Xylophilus sp. Kf1]|nr:TetR family transcriptional regulator [Xylophilus sp. Kf1]
MNANAREAILEAARKAAQSHGYSGLNFRDLAAAVGVKSASVHYHFPTKADLGAAVARRYREDTARRLEALSDLSPDAGVALHDYPGIFRMSLESENRLCLCSFMAAEYDDLPDPVKTEVQAFADINVAWLAKTLVAAGQEAPAAAPSRGRAIFSAIAGAQLIARSRADIAVFDELLATYRSAGLLPA